MEQYKSLINAVLEDGIDKDDRTGVGTRSILGELRRYPLSLRQKAVLPLVTCKKTNFDPLEKELRWFIRGETNINTLGAKIWNEWADEDGELGPIYGKQWRFWDDHKLVALDDIDRRNTLIKRGYVLNQELSGGGVRLYSKQIDQLQNAIDMLRTNPDSRRIIVSAWNPGDIDDMALPPCHSFFQFFSEAGAGKRRLTCLLYQRSADVFLGVPFNIGSYALLTHMVAAVTSHRAVELIHVTGDTHLYQNHLKLAEGLVDAPTYPLATLRLDPRDNIDDFTAEDIHLEGYTSGPYIKAPVAI